MDNLLHQFVSFHKRNSVFCPTVETFNVFVIDMWPFRAYAVEIQDRTSVFLPASLSRFSFLTFVALHFHLYCICMFVRKISRFGDVFIISCALLLFTVHSPLLLCLSVYSFRFFAFNWPAMFLKNDGLT